MCCSNLPLPLNLIFKKIVDPAHIAGSAAVSFSINHIAASYAAPILGLTYMTGGAGQVWASGPTLVFWIGAGLAFASLLSALAIPSRRVLARWA